MCENFFAIFLLNVREERGGGLINFKKIESC